MHAFCGERERGRERERVDEAIGGLGKLGDKLVDDSPTFINFVC